MVDNSIPYEFKSTLWQYKGKGAWYFLNLPQDLSMEIRTHLKDLEEGWGRLKAQAEIGTSNWDTAIWFDSKQGTYLLPVKAEIRKKEGLKEGEEVKVKVYI